MEVKTTQEAQLTDSKMTGEDEKRVQKFINLFASKLRIDFSKDTKITIDIKNKDDGRWLFIKFKDSEVEDVDVSQLNLFKGASEEKKAKSPKRELPEESGRGGQQTIEEEESKMELHKQNNIKNGS